MSSHAQRQSRWPWPMKGFPSRYDLTYEEAMKSEGWSKAASRIYRILTQGGIVILNGIRGSGKTFMACELAKDAGTFPDPWITIPHTMGAKDERPAIYRTADKIFEVYRSAYHDEDVSQDEITEELADASFLVIDEVSKANEKQFEITRLTAIVDSRYRHKRPTMLIGNYPSLKEFVASLDPSIVSRVQECGAAFHCDWPSFRASAVRA